MSLIGALLTFYRMRTVSYVMAYFLQQSVWERMCCRRSLTYEAYETIPTC